MKIARKDTRGRITAGAEQAKRTELYRVGTGMGDGMLRL
jgi:hypothetical protein